MTKIFLDMDGVLVDFEGHVARTFGNVNIEILKKQKPEFRQEISKMKNWWLDIPKMGDAETLWNFVKKHNPIILTAFANWDLTSKEAKVKWMKKHFNYPESKIIVLERRDKKLYARKGGFPNVLIDDYEKNIEEWRHHGGFPIHHVGANSTIAKLRELGFS